MEATGVAAPPSGEQHEITAGSLSAVVTEVGATLRTFTLDGTAVLDGFDADERSEAGRGQVLAPWPNRLEDGSFAFEGRSGQAALNEPELGNAIHGLVRWMPWTVTNRTDSGVTLRAVIHPQPAYPWRLKLSLTYELSDEGIDVTTEATNESDTPAPFGIGFHPYFTIGTTHVNEAVLTVPATTTIAVNERSLPTRLLPVDGSEADFRDGRPIADARLDTAFTGLDRAADGVARVRLARADGTRTTTVWMDRSFGYVQIYTGDTLEPEVRRRRGVAIEPMTCPANALRTGDDVIRLAPGSTWQGAWGIAP
jgi:aldose 1-epimerase